MNRATSSLIEADAEAKAEARCPCRASFLYLASAKATALGLEATASLASLAHSWPCTVSSTSHTQSSVMAPWRTSYITAPRRTRTAHFPPQWNALMCITTHNAYCLGPNTELGFHAPPGFFLRQRGQRCMSVQHWEGFLCK